MGHYKSKYLGTAWFAGVLMFLNIALVNAATINFTGTLGSIEIDNGSSAYSGLTVGDTFSGRITSGDSAGEASYINFDGPTVIEYGFLGAPYGGFISGGSTITAGTNSSIEIRDNNAMEGDALFINNLYGAGSTTENTIADVWGVEGSNDGFDLSEPDEFQFFGVNLYSLDTSLYSSLDLQAVPPALADTDFTLFFIGQTDENEDEIYLATGILTSITVVPDPVPACGTTLTANTTLNADMVCPDRAILFGSESNNVILDCAGHSITTTSDRVISATFASGITIRNCTISTTHDSGRGIVFTEVTNSEISNNSFTTTGDLSRAIGIRGNSSFNLITGNTIHTAGSTSSGIRVQTGSNNNIVTNNTFQADASYAAVIRSASDNELTGNTLISPDGYVFQGKFLLQNGGMSVDSVGNIYAVENNWGSSAGGNSGIGVATAFFQVDPVTGAANSVIPLLSGGVDVGFGFDALDILPDGRFIALAGSGGGSSPFYEINPNTGEVTAIALNLPFLQGKLNGLELASSTSLLATTNQGELVNINLTTGDVTVIGNQSIGWTGLAIHPTSGKAYTVSRRRNEASNTAHLYEIDISTGQVIAEIGDTGILAISGIDFAPDGTLYGNFNLEVIDIMTGLSTTVGSFGADPLEPLPANNTIQNNVMQTDDGSIVFTDSIILPTVEETDISSTRVEISFNEARVDSTALPFLDAPARITLMELSGSSRSLLVDPEDDGSFVPCLSPQCTLVSFTGGDLIFDVTGFTTYSSVSLGAPVPDIRANDSEGPLQIAFSSPLQVDVSLASNDATSQAADWWLVTEAPDGRYWYDLSGNWVKSATPISTYGGDLFDITSMTVLSSSNLPVGSYRISFGVDTNANGVLDLDVLIVDTVAVTIQ